MTHPRDQAISRALETLTARAERATFFVVRRGVAEARMSRGLRSSPDADGVFVVLAQPSAFTRVLVQAKPYLGPLDDPLASEQALLYPVLVRGVPVGLLLVDGLDPDLSDAAWAEPVAAELGASLERLIVERHRDRSEPAGPPSAPEPFAPEPVPLTVTAHARTARAQRLRRATRALASLGGAFVLFLALGAWTFVAHPPASGLVRERPLASAPPAPARAKPAAPKAATTTPGASLRIEANRPRAWVEVDGGARKTLPVTLAGLAPGAVVELRAGAPRCRQRTTKIIAGQSDVARIWLPRSPVTRNGLAESPF